SWSVSDTGPPAQKIIGSILIANLPQAILSFIYLHINGLLTSMFLASEWSGYSEERKGLRVSNPKPDTAQRSTYFLQVPYRVAIPLMVLSGVLHWLVSQSIFLAVVALYAPTGVLLSSVAVASCGFSPMAMIVVLGIGVAIVIVAASLGGLSRFPSGMPLAGSCSAAISAACHAPSWDVDASLKTVKWGVIPGTERGDVRAADDDGPSALPAQPIDTRRATEPTSCRRVPMLPQHGDDAAPAWSEHAGDGRRHAAYAGHGDAKRSGHPGSRDAEAVEAQPGRCCPPSNQRPPDAGREGLVPPEVLATSFRRLNSASAETRASS
ncbi:MAG: hypothetical protein M1823_006650, partial [Watsoniomyces obsoletus]